MSSGGSGASAAPRMPAVKERLTMAEGELHAKDGWPLIAFVDATAFEGWLHQHHEEPTGFWMKIAKKGSGIPSITYDEAVDVALCFGWIDGQKGSYDADWFLQRFSPDDLARSGPRSTPRRCRP